jgi:kynurenine formamidase
VHVHLLIERGIPIVEMLNLQGLARNEFLVTSAALPTAGGTGSPLWRLAIVPMPPC